ELIPFLALAISQKADSHLSSAIGESSKTVPTFTENCCFSCFALHFQILRVDKKKTFSEPQRGHLTTPSGQRIDHMKFKRIFLRIHATVLTEPRSVKYIITFNRAAMTIISAFNLIEDRPQPGP